MTTENTAATVLVAIATPDGTVLERFTAWPTSAKMLRPADFTPARTAASIRDLTEQRYETAD